MPPHSAAMRKMVWMDQPRFRGWGCSQCAWVFNPPGPPLGKTFDLMKSNFESRRDEEFTSHDCAKHPRKPKLTPGAT
jgi:rubredoxin